MDQNKTHQFNPLYERRALKLLRDFADKICMLGIFKILSVFIMLVGLTSCLQEKEVKTSTSSTSSWFEGVVGAQNLGGYPASIKVTWNSASKAIGSYKIYSLEFDSESKTNKWTVVAEVGADSTSFVHSELTSGQIYSYMVRAVDSTDVEDTNSKQVSSVAFDGIASAKTTGKTTATVSLNTANGSFDEVRIYAEPARGGARKLVATAKGSVSSIDVSGLHSGVKYKFSAAAYMNYLAKEDGNAVFIEAQTPSDSFGTGATSDSAYSYRGMMTVQSYGSAANAPVDPRLKMIRLTWPAFSGATSTTKYRVIRASTAYTMDAGTGLACSRATPTATACIVNCTNTGSATQICEDYDIAPAPMTYNYVVTLFKADPTDGEEWAEELPTQNASDFYTKVQVAPDYMVLVHRDAANYEMCQMMGSTSNPRKHQRCTYSGIAATPYNSGPGKPALTFDTGYYDFGYNLFVDRYRLACNWTRTSATCGPNGCIGITGSAAGSAPPSNALGSVGDTYFALNPNWGPNCYYKQSTGWILVNKLTDQNQIRSATSVDPGPDGQKHRPILFNMSPLQAVQLCNSQNNTYGTKRIPRRREFVQMSAFPTLPGEYNSITSKNMEAQMRIGSYNGTLQTGGQLAGYRWCASSNQSSLLAIPATITDLLNPTNTRAQLPNTLTGSPSVLNFMSSGYFIGTVSTSGCISRWGSQEPFTNQVFDGQNAVLADSFIRTNAVSTFPAKFAPVASDYDSGVLYDWGSYSFDGVTGPAPGTALSGSYNTELTSSQITTYPRYVLPLGVPLITNSSIYKLTSDLVFNGVLGASSLGNGPNAYISHTYDSSSLRYSMIEGINHRFSYTLHPDQETVRYKAWCVQEAE